MESAFRAVEWDETAFKTDADDLGLVGDDGADAGEANQSDVTTNDIWSYHSSNHHLCLHHVWQIRNQTPTTFPQ